MTGFSIFFLIVLIVYLILSIIILVRWWKLTTNVNEIKDLLNKTYKEEKISYLLAIGEVEKANKKAFTKIVDKLWPIYYDPYNLDKVDTMNKEIKALLPKMEKLKIILPEFVKSGENFIDYMNDLTGNKVPYHASPNSVFESQEILSD